jgi:hypothetical protein
MSPSEAGASRRSSANRQAGDQQVVVDGVQPLGALGMARAHFVQTAIGVL